MIEPERGAVDPGKLKPVTRMGGRLYGRISEGFTLPRLLWKEREETIREALLGASGASGGGGGGDHAT